MDILQSGWNKYGRGVFRRESSIEYSILVTPASAEYSMSAGPLSPLHDGSHDDLQLEAEQRLLEEPTTFWKRESPHASTLRLPIQQWIVNLAIALLPSFLITPKDKPPRKIYKTSYLDGLRGVAALFVVFHHYAITFTAISQEGYHDETSPETHEWLLLLPFVRVIHSGKFMVSIFFVISGYVLSYRGLKLAREGKGVELLESLGSSVFRRWLRLHLPVIASTFLAFLLARGDAFTGLNEGWSHEVIQKREPLPVHMDSFGEQFWDWYYNTVALCDPMRYGAAFSSTYNINNLWTIPVEWMGSMVVFVTVLGIANMRTWVKVAILVGLVSWCENTTRWEPATFLCGALLAELSLVRSAYLELSTLPVSDEKTFRVNRSPGLLHIAPKIGWALVFLFGIYLGSHPQNFAEHTPGYRALIAMIPSQWTLNYEWFYPPVGAMILVLALENAPFLQRIFTTSIAQYLGHISFSLYMLHGPILFSLSQWLVPKCMDLTGGWANGQVGFGAGMLLAALVFVPVTVWASDVFSRLVDEKCVRLAKVVGEKCRKPRTV
ncbi:hypothetical protein LSUE1_G003028 [Lachnellula suecica]|uniref:Acyltransferase 3 domain-containing protein n=1 Tax=Lachnellula suecica TaxID=602035 RepID=A0A8T9CFU7_9HELO|nr:hypothetical protein LSUE1_G003028 [Lachnellula suecica]